MGRIPKMEKFRLLQQKSINLNLFNLKCLVFELKAVLCLY